METNRRALLLQSCSVVLTSMLAARDAGAETVEYQYDVHGRLTRATYSGGVVVEYSYDAAGNRTSVIRTGGLTPPPAPTCSLTANPTTISAGTSSTLTWTSTNATIASINNGVGYVTPVSGGSVSVSPAVTTTYVMTVTGPGGTSSASAAVAVTGGAFNQTVQVTGTGPTNLRTLANNAGYNGAQDATITYQVGNAVTITGTAGSPNGGIAIDSGTWPGGYTINLTLEVLNGGKVRGGGGGGGYGGFSPGGGGAGGDAIYCRLPMSIVVNSGGEVRSGGGGGNGGNDIITGGEEPVVMGGGGGGGGQPNGPGGTGGGQGGDFPGANGGAGTTSAAGAGGAAAGGGSTNGGNGGAYGAAGSAGGAAGYAVRKNGHTVTVTNNGTITGTVG